MLGGFGDVNRYSGSSPFDPRSRATSRFRGLRGTRLVLTELKVPNQKKKRTACTEQKSENGNRLKLERR